MTEKIDGLLGLEIKVERFEDTSMENGEKAFIIYLKVNNKTPNSRKINLSKATYVTKKREQIEQDIWLSGYITGEDTLKPNSFKKAGLVFYKPKLKSISDNDLIYISIELPKEGTELTLCFKKNETNWILIDKEKTDIEIKLTPKQLEKSLIKRIERLEAFEERLEVSIQNISIKVENYITLFCELHPINGTSIEEDINVECVIYDKEGLVIDKTSASIDSDEFFGFEILEMNFFGDNIGERINKIRIYPKK
jgi:hypothetical protein